MVNVIRLSFLFIFFSTKEVSAKWLYIAVNISDGILEKQSNFCHQQRWRMVEGWKWWGSGWIFSFKFRSSNERRFSCQLTVVHKNHWCKCSFTSASPPASRSRSITLSSINVWCENFQPSWEIFKAEFLENF